MADTRVKLPTFNGRQEDWEEWCSLFETFAFLDDFGDLLVEGYALPNPLTEAAKKKNLRLYAFLRHALDPVSAKTIDNEFRHDGLGAWNYIKKKHSKIDTQGLRHLRREFEALTYEGIGNMENLIGKVASLARQIDSASGKVGSVTEAEMVIRLFEALPATYEGWILTKNAKPADLKLDDLRDELLAMEKYQRSKLSKSTSSTREEVVFYADRGRGRGRGNGRGSGRGRGDSRQRHPTSGGGNDTCHHCGERGHYRSNCAAYRTWLESEMRYCNKNSGKSSNSNQKQQGYSNNSTGSNTVKQQVLAIGGCVAGDEKKSQWIVDSGATSHISHDERCFANYNVVSNETIRAANGAEMVIAGTGDVEFYVRTAAGEDMKITLRQVLHVPQCESHFISVRRITGLGHDVSFRANTIVFYSGQDEVDRVPLERQGNYWVLPTFKLGGLTGDEINAVDDKRQVSDERILSSASSAKITGVSTSAATIEVWHARLGHTPIDEVLKLRGRVEGIDVKDGKATQGAHKCGVCTMEKMAAKSFGDSNNNSARPLQRIHSDVFGPYRTGNIAGGERYLISFIDDFSGFQLVYAMKTKSESLAKFKRFLADVKKYTACTIELLRTDNGGEYLSKEFEGFCDDNGIRREFTIPYTPQQNGTAERNWRTLCNMARCMLGEMELGEEFWVLAVLYASYIRNRTLTTSNGGEKTPYELMTGQQPSMEHIRVFGTPVIYLNNDPARGKFESKGLEGIFVGVSERVKGFVIYNENRRAVTTSRTVEFNERIRTTDGYIDVKSGARAGVPSTTVDQGIFVYPMELPDNDVHGPAPQLAAPPVQPHQMQPVVAIPQQPLAHGDAAQQQPVAQQGRVQRKRIPTKHDEAEGYNNPLWYGFQGVNILGSTADEVERFVFQVGSVSDRPMARDIPLPGNIEEAMAHPDWREGTLAEYDSLVKNGTWSLERLPAGKRAVSSKWVWKVKQDSAGYATRYKARLVARGFTQQYGIDFVETYSPTVKATTTRLLIAVAKRRGLFLDQGDFETAYLNSKVEEEIYMAPPPGFETYDEDGHLQVCKLKKSIYGLRQAARNWNQLITEWLVAYGFVQSRADPCLFIIDEGGDGFYLALTLYVDDLLSATNDRAWRAEFIRDMKAEFAFTDLGPVKWLLGMELLQDENSVVLNQKQFIKDILTRYHMDGCRSQPTPIVKAREGPKDDEQRVDQRDYQSVVGSLNYLAVFTRPDIAYAVSQAGQSSADPTDDDLQRVKRVLRYLSGHQDYQVRFDKDGDGKVVGYCDADWAESVSRHSTSGFIFFFGGGPISWASRKQSVIALSSTEAEYISLSTAAQEAAFIAQLLRDFGYDHGPIEIFCDNQGAIKLSDSTGTKARTKHIDVRFHYVKDAVQAKRIKVSYMQTDQQPADILTKPTGRVTFERHIKRIYRIHDNDKDTACNEGGC
jgi:hypothetical protein